MSARQTSFKRSKTEFIFYSFLTIAKGHGNGQKFLQIVVYYLQWGHFIYLIYLLPSMLGEVYFHSPHRVFCKYSYIDKTKVLMQTLFSHWNFLRGWKILHVISTVQFNSWSNYSQILFLSCKQIYWGLMDKYIITYMWNI